MANFVETYDLTQGQSYFVAAVALWEYVPRVLVLDDAQMPNWIPLGAFRSEPVAVPENWALAIGDGIGATGKDLWSHPLVAWMGHASIVGAAEENELLMDRDPAALARFRALVAAEAAGTAQSEAATIERDETLDRDLG